MSNLGIDYSELKNPSGPGGRRTGRGGRTGRDGRQAARNEKRAADGRKRATGVGNRRRGLFRLPIRLVRWAAFGVVLAVLPFVLLIRGGVFAYHEWGLGTWPSLAISAAATALLLTLYAWAASRRIGAGKGLKKLLTRAAALLGAMYVAYSLIFVAGANVKSDEVRAEYSALHPLLRVAASALILLDPGAVITDAGRTPDFYRRMGLSPNETSLHFEQQSGFLHALDLRTVGRPEWRNRAAGLAVRAMGFHTLRHVGTADHLHVSLRPPG